MCGITGIVTKNPASSSSSASYGKNIQHMAEAINYRGPDERGSHVFNNCILGHVRLSIVDLIGGQQPMLTSDKKVGIVFNGEIYGYQEIKKTLKSDYHFNNNSDTEVILALYKKYGPDLVEHLPGMFSFAIWDDVRGELFCARDRFGEKPFFYAYGKNGELVFASEIKAILASGFIEPVIDRTSVAHYLKHLYVNPCRTIYSNIFVLPPAHTLHYKNGSLSVKRYWNFPTVDRSITLDEATKKFRALFTKAVSSQLIADVPVGAFLSGGLDSSSIVAVASQFKKKIKTFSFRFENSTNELPFAREIAKKYDTDHTELCDNDYDIAELLVKMNEVFDEPFADSSNIPTYLISKLARQHVKVVLTGDGGDELLGGYAGWYKPLLYAQERIQKNKGDMAAWQTLLLPYLVKAFYKFRLPYKNNLGFTHAGVAIQNSINASPNNIADALLAAHAEQNSYFTDTELDELFLKKTSVEPYHPHWKTSGTLDDVMFMDVDNYMPGDILTKVDRASMANSIELRAPFLDRNFAEFCLSLPYTLKTDKSSDKIILRKAFSDYWTNSIRRRSKQGFGAPVHRWLNLPSVKRLKEKYLTDPHQNIFKILSFARVQNIAKQDTYQTWTLLVLAIWMEHKKLN